MGLKQRCSQKRHEWNVDLLVVPQDVLGQVKLIEIACVYEHHPSEGPERVGLQIWVLKDDETSVS